jgi:concanavalin A-like lectin/glucanase superfamily protein/F5/8 type C domain-containing protein
LILKNLFPFYGTNFLKFSFLLFCWTILIFSSSDIKNNLVNNANAQSCGANLNINSATASGNDGNVPSNVLDNDLGTRWSSLGDGQFITADLGSSKKICSVDIAWYNGNVRQNHFVISTSTDGSTFSNKFSGDSSGTTLESEKYMLSTVTDARYVRVTVNGNTVNNWASITELDISGLSSISSVGYNYDPSFTATGSNFYDVASTSALQISQFSVAAWFKTSSDFATDVTIVNKGGFGSETTGQNMNYGIWMNNAEKVKGGFETGTGTDFYVTSPNSYADNQWHYAVVTYDGSTVKLYIDGAQVGSKSTSGASADKTGTQPVRVGANSRTTPPTANFFIGNVDEVRVWNDDLTAQQVSDAFAGTSFNTAEQVLYLNFSVGDESYTYAPSFTATGSNFFDVASTSSLKLSQFSVAAWFKTATDFASEAFIVNKGGTGSETAGQNQNYQISMTSTEKIKGGFETSTGADFFVTSPNTYNDNHWHYAVVTYDGTTLRLYVDGAQVASKSTSGASPDSSGTKPVRIGANSRTTPPTGNFFIGNVDEVRVWNDDLTAQQVSDAFAGTSFNTAEQVLFLPFTNIGAGTDIFGIKKLYQTKSNGEEWYIDMNNPLSDSRFDPQNTITKNPDGSWKMKSSKVRMNVYTSTGYDSNDIPTLDHSKIASKGYMLAPNDWRNFEMTQYVKVNTSPTDDSFTPYGRGGRHTGSGPPEGCEGSAMKGDVFFSGKVRFAKEQWHVSYVFTSLKTATSSIVDKWVGIKFVVYNFVENGKLVDKTELWMDTNNNGNFVKVNENVDRGGWGTEDTECGGAPDQIITWGGPITTFRWDTATDVDFKNLSVREIVPPQ